MTTNNQTTIPCTSFPDSPDDCDTVNVVRKVVGAISCLCCLFVILVIWLFGRCSIFAQRLILYLTIAALFNSFGRILQESTNENGGWCTFQAFWQNYFNYAVMLWVVCITFNLFMNIIRRVPTRHNEKWYHALCWGLSLAVSMLPFFGHHYGPSGAWCWIVKDIGWQLGIWYIPLFTVLISLVFVYGYIIFTVYKEADTWAGIHTPDTRQAQELLKESVKPLRFYPILFVLLSIFPLANRIHNATTQGSHSLGLVLLHAISACIQGAAYALLFTIDRDTLHSLQWKNIKAAVLKKLAPRAVVEEYPAVAVVGPEAIMQMVIVDHSSASAEDHSVALHMNPLDQDFSNSAAMQTLTVALDQRSATNSAAAVQTAALDHSSANDCEAMQTAVLDQCFSTDSEGAVQTALLDQSSATDSTAAVQTVSFGESSATVSAGAVQTAALDQSCSAVEDSEAVQTLGAHHSSPTVDDSSA